MSHHPERRTIEIVRQVVVRPRAHRNARRIFVRETTKGRRTRKVRIDAATADALKAWKATQAKERLAYAGSWKVDGGLGVERPWVVTEEDGGVVSPETLLGRWKRLVRAAGVTPITIHGGRHSFTELALSSGARLDVVSRGLGHSTAAFTADQYLHDNDPAAAEVAEIVGRAIEGR